MNDKKNSSAQIAYENIKDWIVSGFLVPGEKINQDDLASKLNYSRMPIRSALDRLSSEGLVVKIPHRGVLVSKLSDTELNQVFELRAHIESMIVIQAALHASEEGQWASIETYQTSELLTYSEATLRALLANIEALEAEGKDFVFLVQENTVLGQGFQTMAEAEKAMAAQFLREMNIEISGGGCCCCGSEE